MSAKIREHFLSVFLLWIILNGCASPIGTAEVLPISQQATVAGVYAVKTGAEPLGRILQNANGLQVVIWPGAQGSGEQLWNFACLIECKPGWEGEVTRYIAGPGRTMTWMRMSNFVEYLKQSGWVQISAASSAAVQAIGSAVQTMSGALVGFMVVPVMPIPAEAMEGPKT